MYTSTNPNSHTPNLELKPIFLQAVLSQDYFQMNQYESSILSILSIQLFF